MDDKDRERDGSIGVGSVGGRLVEERAGFEAGMDMAGLSFSFSLSLGVSFGGTGGGGGEADVSLSISLSTFAEERRGEGESRREWLNHFRSVWREGVER